MVYGMGDYLRTKGCPRVKARSTKPAAWYLRQTVRGMQRFFQGAEAGKTKRIAIGGNGQKSEVAHLRQRRLVEHLSSFT